MGRTIIALGILLVVIGLAVELGPRLPFRIGRLPGDIYIHGKNRPSIFRLSPAL